jgi:FecR protein/Putative zinc-finger
MSCHELQSQLMDLLDGRLDAPSELRVHAHLEGCEDCREHVATWSALVPAMRGLAPAPPTPLQQRRMEAQIERRLGEEQARPRAARRIPAARKVWLGASAAALVAAAFAAVIGLRPPRPAAFALVTSRQGTSALGVGSSVAVPEGDEVTLALASGASLEVWGAAALELGGDAAHVALHLAKGKMFAEVVHRRPEQTFTVEVPGGKIEVRGTRFTVFAGADASWVDVERGQVLVWDASGEQTVSAHERHVFKRAVPAPVAPPPAPPATSAQQPPPASASCTQVDCRRTTHLVREAMRRRDYKQAVALIDATLHQKSCSSRSLPCRDELGYLHAETLRLAGHLDEAVTIYQSLDRDGAPPEMRQNALYAAAQLERRLGRLGPSRADYEAALAAFPRGVLREEAMLGAMEAADEAADVNRALAAAGRYLAAFPTGLGAARAKRIESLHRTPRDTAP